MMSTKPMKRSVKPENESWHVYSVTSHRSFGPYTSRKEAFECASHLSSRLYDGASWVIHFPSGGSVIIKPQNVVELTATGHITVV